MIRFVTASVAASLCLAAVGVHRWNNAAPAAVARTFDIPVLLTASDTSDAALADAESTVVASDMFRAPHDVVSRAARAPGAPLSPAMSLKAIVGGPPWQAIVDGLPGQPPGAVVQSGARFGAITILAIGRDSVRVRSADSVWTLTFRRLP